MHYHYFSQLLQLQFVLIIALLLYEAELLLELLLREVHGGGIASHFEVTRSQEHFYRPKMIKHPHMCNMSKGKEHFS